MIPLNHDKINPYYKFFVQKSIFCQSCLVFLFKYPHYGQFDTIFEKKAMSDYLSGFDDWTKAFDDWTDISIHELHGLMTGIVCLCNAPKSHEWQQLLAELSFAPPSEPALALLTEYGEDVSFALKDKDDAYAFEPLLPDDEHELEERLLALKDWAGGFLTGVGIADISPQKDENELLATLSKIGALRLEYDDDGNLVDADESMFFELFEFARMVPVSLAVRKRKSVGELAIIKGLAMGRKTAQELHQETQTLHTLPPTFDIMGKH